MMKLDAPQIEQARSLVQHISTKPIFFTSEILGDNLWGKQQDIINSVRDNKVTSVRSCHDIGKSFTAARTALWFLQAHPNSIVITTAPTFRQVEHIIWREMRGAYKASRIPLGGKSLTTRLEFSEEWYAIGISTDEPDRFQGFHAKSGHILVIVDEAAGVDEEVFKAIESVLSSQGARLLMIGNPTSLTGTFYDSHHKDPNAHRIHISCFDTPNFTNNGIRNLDDLMKIDMSKIEIVAPWLITPEWVKDKVTRWGVDSPMFQARCLGNFPSAEVNSLIPLNLIEAAATPERRERIKPGRAFLGVDVARYGDDTTVLTPRRGLVIDEQVVFGKQSTTFTVGKIKQQPTCDAIMIDCDGVGGPVADMLIDDGYDNIVEIYSASKAEPEGSTDDDEAPSESGSLTFVNLRSQLWWHAAEIFKRGEIAIPDDPELISQLSSPRYTVTRRGIAVESKDELRKPKRLGVSPDKADSLIYSLADFLFTTDKAGPSVGKTYEEMYNDKHEDY